MGIDSWIDERRERERESFCVLELGELVRIPGRISRVFCSKGVSSGLKVIREWL